MTRVEYEKHSGTEYGVDFAADISENAVSFARFYSEEAGEYVTKTSETLVAGIWGKIEKTVAAMADSLVPAAEKPPKSAKSGSIHLLDGSDVSSLHLSFRDPDGAETRICCQIPRDRRFFTLLELLLEAADLAGREICFYGPPELCGILAVREKNPLNRRGGYSYQLSDSAKDASGWRFNAYFTENGEDAKLNAYVGDDLRLEAVEKLMALGLEALPDVKSGRSRVELRYTDGYRNRTVNPDKKTLERIREIFSALAKKVKNAANPSERGDNIK